MAASIDAFGGGVLVLHNDPGGCGDSAWAESEAGVLREAQAVADALAELGIPHRRAGIRRLGELPGLLAAAPEPAVFNLVEGLAGGPDDANAVPAVCRALGRACTGNDRITLDKWQTKAALEAFGVPAPRAVVVPVGARPIAADLPAGSLIVKPLRADGSEGIDAASVVPGAGRRLLRAVRRVHEAFGQPALVEQFIDGREVNVSVIEQGPAVRILPLAEIDFSAFGPDRPRIVDYAAKWHEDSFEFRNTPRKVPADLPAGVARAVRQAARGAWRAVGCQDYARVDCRIDRAGQPHVIEVNPNPDIAPDAGFQAALAAAKVPFCRFVLAMLDNARRRQGGARAPARRGRRSRNPGDRPPAGVQIRWSRQADREAILKAVADTGLFRPGEVDVAREVLDESLRHGPDGHYQSHTAVLDGRAVGWVCFGPTPCTEGTFDLYWIVVDPARQGRGIGKALMDLAEGLIAQRGGRLVVAETSGRADYDPTRRFYLGMGYRQASRVEDFYAPGDAKVIFLKDLPPRQ